MGKERNKRVLIGLPEYLLSHAKVTAKMRGLKLDQLIQEALSKYLLDKLVLRGEAIVDADTPGPLMSAAYPGKAFDMSDLHTS